MARCLPSSELAARAPMWPSRCGPPMSCIVANRSGSPDHDPCLIPGASIVTSSNDFGGWYRARGRPGESACGRAPNPDPYQRPDTGRTVSN
jgi:hypothetical protein